MNRVKSVDVARGIAVFWMVFFQTFDFFSRDFQMYGSFWYIFLDWFNWLPLFMVVSGVSLWLMVDKRLQRGQSRIGVLLNGVKRYGFYVVLSFTLCLWCFSLEIFLRLNEIVGAIGVFIFSALVLLLVFYRYEVVFIPLTFLVFGLSFFTRQVFLDRFYPFYFILPFFYVGIFISKYVTQKKIREMLAFDLSLLPIIALLFLFGDKFSYVDKTLGFVVFNSFWVILTFIFVTKFEHWKMWNIFSFVGRHALIFYVAHFAVWFKLLEYLELNQTFDLLSSALLTIIAVAIIAIVAKIKAHAQSQ